MKFFKFLSITLLAGLIGIALPACRQEKKYRIGVSQCSDDDWRKKMNEEIEREVMFHDNVEVEIRSADDSNEHQIADLNYFADNGFDIIITAPNESDPITPTIDSIMARGIPVVVFDRTVTDHNYTAFQGADNDSIGIQVADYVNQLPGDKKRVLEIFGNPGSSPARGRHNGFIKQIDLYPDVELIASGVGNWNYERAAKVADSLLTIYPDAEVIYAHNDRMALAASDVADNKGLHPFIIGVDAAPQIGMKGVAEGKIKATFLYPTEGHEVIRTALDILEGKPYDKESILKATSVVDESNADILLLQDQSLREETSKMERLKTEVDRYWKEHRLQTVFLYILGGLLLMLFILLFLFLRAFWKTQRQQAQLVEQNKELETQRDNERRLNEQLQQATQSKLMFFTNVSHDLRTPLTLIAEPVRQLSEADNLTPPQKTMMRLALKNVRILQRLINQVLDFRKYENGRLSLSLTEVNIYSLVEDWTEAFLAEARRRHMKLSIDSSLDNSLHLALDVEKIERVFFNLLSNAFKYTPDNGNIDVSLKSEGDNLIISVADSGRGIPPEDIANIFDRFFQVDKVHPKGSGIGLSLAKAFVELHEGSLSVVSELGKGSVFTVSIPIKHVAETPVEVKGAITGSDVSDEVGRIERQEPALPSDSDSDEERPLVLVIDDNTDILILLSELLNERYRVITAPNGSEGVRLAAKYVPDLVICDVMMPVMDGLECCRRIKSEVSTSHIPVLMLTACSMDEQRVQGYESGADGYLSKPFSDVVLSARCDSLIQNRRRIIDLYSADKNIPAPTRKAPQAPASQPGDIDNEFYRRFIEIFRASMSNPDVNVDALAAEMGLGRSQFYRKIKALTNFSPVELIRNIRLKEARNLLLTSEMTVSEIAYAVGFSTPAYFTKCYRESFGETPSDTRANLVAP